MAQITVTYSGFDDMVAMAKALIAQVENGTTPAAPVGQQLTPAVVPAAVPVQQQPTAAITQQAAPAVVPSVAPVQQQPSAAITQQAAPVVPTKTRTYTREELQLAAAPLMDAGKFSELQNLLKQFGASSLIDLPADQYGAFATALRGIGANI